MRSVWTKINGWLVHAIVCGSNDSAASDTSIVLVHGLGMSHLYMLPTAERLAEKGRVYAPDLPGFGRSDKPRRALKVCELTDVLAMWMKANQLRHALLIGNSFGAQIIVNLALRYPELITRAVLVAPTIDPRAQRFSKQLARLLLDAPREPMRLILIAMYDYLRAGLIRIARTLQYALAEQTHEKLRHVNVPTLIVCGGRDPIVPERWAQEAARLLPEGALVTFPRAAHAINYSAPNELVEAVREFTR
jgi:pimeloyl-ACP methyl ester carboxylesterase